MSKIFNIANLYMSIATLYLLQDVAYEGGSLLSKLIIAIFVAFSFAMWIIATLRYKLPLYCKGLNILLAMFTIYGIALLFSHDTYSVWAFSSEVSKHTYILSIYLSLLPIYAFYIFTLNGKFTTSSIQFWSIILLISSVLRFLSYYFTRTSVVGTDEITNTYGYLFVGFIPLLVFFAKRPLLQYTFLAVCTILVIFSMKRGAMLILAVGLVPFVWSMLQQGSRLHRTIIVLFLIAFTIAGVYFMQHMLSTSEYFLVRIEDTLSGNTSHRDILKTQIWDYYFNDASFIQKLIGGGANHTLKIADNYAHNDWLEILVNQGIFGVIMYILYWIGFYRTYRISKRTLPQTDEAFEIRTVLFITLVASLCMTTFSMSYANLPLGFTMALGIALGKFTIAQNDTNE